MKKIAIAILVLVQLGFAANKNVPGQNVFTVLDRGRAWSAFAGGAGDTYTFDTIGPGVGVCFLIHNNNPTNSRNVTVNVAQTNDPANTFVTRASYALTLLARVVTMQAGGEATVFARTFGAAHIFVSFYSQGGVAGGSPDTVDLLAVQTGNCADAITTNIAPSGTGAQPVTGQTQWTAFLAPGAAVQPTIAKAAVAGVRHTAQCYAVSVSGAASGNEFVIRDGACGAGTIIWQGRVQTTTADADHDEQCGFQLVGTAGNAMCIEFTAAPGAGAFGRVALAGIDQ